jgi:hypothetical protein
VVAESAGDSPDEGATEDEDADARFPPLLTRRRIEPSAVCTPVEADEEEVEDTDADDEKEVGPAAATADVTMGGGVMLMLGIVLTATGISAADVRGAVDTNAGVELPLAIPLVLPLALLAINPKLPPGTKAGALAESRIVLLRAGASARFGGVALANCTDLVVDDSSANAVRPKSPTGFLDGLGVASATAATDAGLAPLRGVVTKPRC